MPPKHHTIEGKQATSSVPITTQIRLLCVQEPLTEKEADNIVTMVWGDTSSQEDKKEWESIPVEQSPEISRSVCVARCWHL